MKPSHSTSSDGGLRSGLSSPAVPDVRADESSRGERPTPIPSKSSWRHLFAFMERRHAGSLIMAVIAAACAAGAKTSYAVLLGKVMDIVTPLGAGTISKESAMAGVTLWCIILTAVGAGVWLFNSAFMAAWVIFGELTAKSTRQTIFGSLLYKEMAWFDSQDEGVSSALSSIQV